MITSGRAIGVDTGSRWNAVAAIDLAPATYVASTTIDAGLDIGSLEPLSDEVRDHIDRVSRLIVQQVLAYACDHRGVRRADVAVAVECSATDVVYGRGGPATAKRIQITRAIALRVARILRSAGYDVREVPRNLWARKLTGRRGAKVEITPALRAAVPSWPASWGPVRREGEYPLDHERDAGGVAYALSLPDPEPTVKRATVPREPRPARTVEQVKADRRARQKAQRADPTSAAAACVRRQLVSEKERAAAAKVAAGLDPTQRKPHERRKPLGAPDAPSPRKACGCTGGPKQHRKACELYVLQACGCPPGYHAAGCARHKARRYVRKGDHAATVAE